MDFLVFLLLLVAVGGGYLVSIWFHPYTACEACKGSGKHKGAVFNYGFRPCHKCSGVGRKQRWGAQWFSRGQPRREGTKTPPGT